MNAIMIKRIMDEANYMIETHDTIRKIATVFRVSKSTVHKDLHERLLYVSKDLYDKVYDILKYHIDVRHIRGEKKKKKKYEKLV